MITELNIDEIIRINNKEFVIIETAIGGCDKKRISLIYLSTLIKNMYRKPYFNRQVKGGLKEDE